MTTLILPRLQCNLLVNVVTHEIAALLQLP